MRIRIFPEQSIIFTSQKTLYRYLYGGHAIVTLSSPSGVKHVYSYEAPINRHQFPDDVIFVYAVHFEDDDLNNCECKKFYLGMIENDNFRMTRNSRFLYESPIIQGVFYIEKLRKSQEFLSQSRMTISHNGTCARCGSKISSDKSRIQGFGRACYKKFKIPDFAIDV